jgi:hypothetical protein
MSKTENNQRHIIWLIDEKERELNTHSNILRRIMPSSMEVRPIKPYRQIDESLTLLENPGTVCIITDQRLKDTGIATYTGIELAKFIRGVNSKIPVYILTNFADDKDEFMGDEWTVEDIIKKSEMNTEDGQEILKARILRRINIYEDVRDEREENFKALLRKSLDGELEEAELQELEELRLLRTSPTLARELSQIKQMGEIVKAHEEFMRQLKQSHQVEDNDVV